MFAHFHFSYIHCFRVASGLFLEFIKLSSLNPDNQTYRVIQPHLNKCQKVVAEGSSQETDQDHIPVMVKFMFLSGSAVQRVLQSELLLIAHNTFSK